MLARKIKKLFPDINFHSECILQDDSDGNGAYIKKWNRIEPKPTQDELGAVSVPTDAEIEAIRLQDIADKQAVEDTKTQEISEVLPNWSAVSTAVDDIADLASAKVFIKKLARITYWLAKNTDV